MPEVWVSELRILLLWLAEPSASDVGTVEGKLRGFNDRLYDCTDGQWRIGRFLVQDVWSWLRVPSRGVGHIHRTDPHGPHGHADGRPDDPKHWHVNENRPVGTYLMEFLHSWTGLKDEYEESEDGPRTNCPAERELRDDTNACVMDTSYGTPTELCRPGTHNPNTEQGNVRGIDCYTWLRRVMEASGHPGFQVPEVHIPGPRSAPHLRFVYLVIQRVRQIDDPDPTIIQGEGDYFAKVRMSRSWFARTGHRDNRPVVTPNWFFGFGFSSDQHATIPIRIEIWDDDEFSSPDMCDTSPVDGKRELDILFSTSTGQITGDASGSAGVPITVRGSGDDNRVETTFVITSRS